MLSTEVATVPELLPGAYTTHSVVSNPNAGPAKELDRGFDHARYLSSSTLREGAGLRRLLKSASQLWAHGGGLSTDVQHHKGLVSYLMTDLTEELVAGQRDPYFLYVHLNSSHHPYLPPAAYLDRYCADLEVSPKTARQVAQSRYENVHELIASGGLSDDEWAAVTAMYDAVVSHVDHCVGRVVDAVRARDDDTIVVVTADHGDLLGEYDLAGHKFVTHDALTHVPLVTVGLDGVDHQRDAVVQHIDVLKTVLSRAGVDHDQLEGVDLTRERREYAVTQRSGNNARKNLDKVCEYNPEYELPIPHPRTLTSVRSTDRKLLYSEDATQLFALPDESHDVAAQFPEATDRMESYATRWLEEHPQRSAAGRTRALDADIQQHLSDMGYV